MVYPEEKNVFSVSFERRWAINFTSHTAPPVLWKSPAGTIPRARAVRFMADYYGVPVERTIAAGDSLNDLPMLEAAGLGLAVKTPTKRLKDKALSFEYSNDENAIGKIIETYGFTGEKE